MGAIKYTIRMRIGNEKELNELLNNKPRTSFNSNSIPLDKMVYSKLYGSVSNLFLYYQDLKDKLNNALDRELEKIEYLEQLLTKDNKMNGLDMFSHFTGKSGRALTLYRIDIYRMNFKMLESSDIKTFKFNNIIVFQTCTLKYLEYIPYGFQDASRRQGSESPGA
ncbi:hypothetical protein [Photorhabdus bodei]|uniref:Uncharacterized protein n=1 Tax=Photorhabdus bodei TaxID=2029681 RepID=A0AAW6BJE0_9GAMM|nr:hypothetical protein [Photorhabdus bodei]MDB6373547.1 hypothetical protein [Photorhabdus bodei]